MILRNLLQSPVVRRDLGIVRAEPTPTRTTEQVTREAFVTRAAPARSSPEELTALVDRVASLEQQLAALQQPVTTRAASAKAAPKKAATRKAAAKKAPAKKAAPRKRTPRT